MALSKTNIASVIGKSVEVVVSADVSSAVGKEVGEAVGNGVGKELDCPFTERAVGASLELW